MQTSLSLSMPRKGARVYAHMCTKTNCSMHVHTHMQEKANLRNGATCVQTHGRLGSQKYPQGKTERNQCAASVGFQGTDTNIRTRGHENAHAHTSNYALLHAK